MTSNLARLRALEEAADELPGDLGAWAVQRLRETLTPAERRAERDQLLVEAARRLPGSVWVRAGELERLIVLLLRRPDRWAELPLDSVEGLLASALQVYPRRPDRAGLSRHAIRRVLLGCVGGVATQAGPVRTSAERRCNHMARIDLIAEERDQYLRRGVAALLQRVGMSRSILAAKNDPVNGYLFRDVELDPGPFRGASAVDLARQALELNGRRVVAASSADLVRQALELRGSGQQGTADFAVLLETAVNKAMLAAYVIAPATWRRWCAVKSVRDFRNATFYRPGSFGSLDSVTESGELKHKNIPDATKATLALSTKGNIVGISRMALANDDLGAFDLAAQLGAAAAISVEVDAWAMVTANSGLGAKAPDGTNLFDASHANIGSSGAMSVATLDSLRAKIGLQKDPGSQYLDIRPHVLLAPVELGGTAKVFNESAADPTDLKNANVANRVKGLFPGGIVDSPFLSASSTTRHYAVADPNIAPVFAVGFLNGQETPSIETAPAFEYDGVRYRIVFDYGTAVLDHRGAATCPGS